MKLPSVYLVICADDKDYSKESKEKVAWHLRSLLQAGVRLIQYRDPLSIGSASWQRAVQEIAAICHEYDACLLVNMPATECAGMSMIDGVHISSAELLQLSRRPSSIDLLAASCHSLPELQQAQRLGADFVTLSPVCATQTHPGQRALGWDCFSHWVEQCEDSVIYAQGGITLTDWQQAQKSGAYGIAMYRGLWQQTEANIKAFFSRM